MVFNDANTNFMSDGEVEKDVEEVAWGRVGECVSESCQHSLLHIDGMIDGHIT
jgi:hypothetical protein